MVKKTVKSGQKSSKKLKTSKKAQFPESSPNPCIRPGFLNKNVVESDRYKKLGVLDQTC